MIRAGICFLLVVGVMSCENEVSETLPMNEVKIPSTLVAEQLFKTLYNDNGGLQAVFYDLEDSVFNVYAINDQNEFVFKRSIAPPVLNQPQVKVIPGANGNLFLYSPQDDTCQLAQVNAGQIKWWNLNAQPKLYNQGLMIADQPANGIKNFNTNSSTFEFELMAFSQDTPYPLSAALNLATNTVDFEGILCPESYLKNYYGFLNGIEQVFTDDYIFYSPLAKSEIWQYNRKDETVTIIPVKSKYDHNDVQPLKDEELNSGNNKTILESHRRASGHYSTFLYNSNLDEYYRFYVHPLPEKNENGTFNTYEDTQISLIILNAAMEVRQEIMLPETCFFMYTAVPVKDGLVINHGPLMKENYVNLLHIKTRVNSTEGEI